MIVLGFLLERQKVLGARSEVALIIVSECEAHMKLQILFEKNLYGKWAR